MTFDEWFEEQYPNADLTIDPVSAVRDKMFGAWCAALEWGSRPTSTNKQSTPLPECPQCHGNNVRYDVYHCDDCNEPV